MKKLLKTAAVTGGILCAVKGLDNRLEVTRYNISSKKIPTGFNGFRILQISDYHGDSVPGLVEEIARESPDIIVSTGDLVHDKGSYAAGVRLCGHLSDIAPVYAVTGNHDVWRGDYKQFETELTAAGVITLHNERVILERGGGKIALSGIDDPFSMNNSKINENIQNALSKLPRAGVYDILLFHRANLFDTLKYHGFDLILAGHMHGGQFRLPGGRGVVSPKSSWASKAPVFFPKYVGGYYKSPRTDMIVSRGVGNPMFIPRLFNRPEITVVQLHSDEK
ncbi:MAG: metallophosphoesterase [Firmicutes bacterium]|nr:metallophosphoesterase [Bacillota bacterium]